MGNRIKHPPSVRAAQILLALATITLLPHPIRGVFRLFNVRYSRLTWPDLWYIVEICLIDFLFVILLITLFLVAIVGLLKHRVYGRWLAIVSLSIILLGLAGIRIFGEFTPDSPFYVSATIIHLVTAGLSIFLILRLLFASYVDSYFVTESSSNPSTSSSSPPPPPSFDA